jgi:ABC-type molybdate transport system substrate-binding protein
MSTPGRAEPVQLYAAGSLRAALTGVAKAFSSKMKSPAAHVPTCSPRPTWNIRKRSSAAKKSGPVQLFARNRLCALDPGLNVNSANLLERMLDPAIKLAISTPKADPSGDYALEVFAKAESIKSGAQSRPGREGGATHRQRRQRPATGRPQCLWLARRGRPRRY